MKNMIKQLKLNKQGLIPAIIQDHSDNTVLMLGYMNKEAVKLTLKTKKVHFFSRSKKRIWIKGESSKHFQIVKSIYFDCDNDVILVKVKQVGNAACHTGYRSCFYKKLTNNSIKKTGKKVFEPKEVY